MDILCLGAALSDNQGPIQGALILVSAHMPGAPMCSSRWQGLTVTESAGWAIENPAGVHQGASYKV
jgi:hypothetical protein